MIKIAEIIAIGDEILGGRTVDTNSSWLAAELKKCGILIAKKQVVSDSLDEIFLALDQIKNTTKFVFISGGLGPTRDDLTKDVITKYFGGTLEFDQEIYDNLAERYKIRGKDFLEINKEQCYFPDNAEKILNSIGTATGMVFTKNECTYFVLPGVPQEFKGMYEHIVLPDICSKIENQYEEINLRTTGIPESELAVYVEKVMQNYTDILLGYYPSYHGVDLRLSAVSKSDKIRKLVRDLKSELGDIIYEEGYGDLVETLAELIKNSKYSFAVAESCSGGLVSHRITSFSGASDYFKEGIVVYSNEAKMKYLDVQNITLDKFGAVSRETVTEMLKGLKKRSGADICAAISGIAGPGGGSVEKPVGTVWMGVAFQDKEIVIEKHFTNNRKRNIHLSTQALINLIRLFVLDSPQLGKINQYWK